MANVLIHTDGSCWPNPGGPGGWAAVIDIDGKQTEISGNHPGPTTNNRMEIQAAIEALRAIPPWSTVQVNTDSQYLRNAAVTWIRLWKKRGWMTKENTPVKNVDLWIELDSIASRHKIKWKWVKSHRNTGNSNDRCDALANNRRIGSALEKEDTARKRRRMDESTHPSIAAPLDPPTAPPP